MKTGGCGGRFSSIMYLYDKFSEVTTKRLLKFAKAEDIGQEERKENMTNTFNALLEMGIIP